MASQRQLTLTVLGGGSFYVPSFIGTMCRTPEVFASTQVRLHDIDSERVRLVKQFCEQFVKAKNVPMTFHDEPDLERALEGTDFVVATFRIGGVKSTILDETIPPEFGYCGDETAGPGGLFMAMRTLPVIVDVARKMERICPDAWLMNYANPTNFLADGVLRTTRINTVSLCDGYICPPYHIAGSLGIPSDGVEALHAGLNHYSFVYRAEREGRDLLQELANADPAAVRNNLAGTDDFTRYHLWLAYKIFKLYRVYPSIIDHMACYFNHDEVLAGQLKKDRAYYESAADEEHIKENWNSLKAQLRDFRQEEADKVARAHEGGHADLAIGVIRSIVADSGELFPVNVPNRGAIPGMDSDTIVELYARVDRHGFTPLVTPSLPPSILARLNHFAAYQKLVVSGILDKDYHTLLQALSIHPATTSIDRASEIFKAMLEREKEVMGEYWRDVRPLTGL